MRWRTALFKDVRAEILFFSDGPRNPNFIQRTPSETIFWEISQTMLVGFLKFPDFVLPAFSHVLALATWEFSSFPARFGNFRQ